MTPSEEFRRNAVADEALRFDRNTLHRAIFSNLRGGPELKVTAIYEPRAKGYLYEKPYMLIWLSATGTEESICLGRWNYEWWEWTWCPERNDEQPGPVLGDEVNRWAKSIEMDVSLVAHREVRWKQPLADLVYLAAPDAELWSTFAAECIDHYKEKLCGEVLDC